MVGNLFGKDLQVLCIDEFQVLHISDAMILKRLFESLQDSNITLMITSNRPPKDLYLNGLQRFLFEPFIEMINEQYEVINVSSIDYRLLNTMGLGTYFSPIGSQETDHSIQELWKSITKTEGMAVEIKVAQGRTITCYNYANKVGEFTF